MEFKKHRLNTRLSLKPEVVEEAYSLIIKKLLDFKKLVRIGEGRGIKYEVVKWNPENYFLHCKELFNGHERERLFC